MCCWLESACPYFDHGADAGRNKDEQAGLLVEQIQENHDGAEASPQHWGKTRQIQNLVSQSYKFLKLIIHSSLPVS